MRHQDFNRIRNEFVSYYKDSVKGEAEYYVWLNALHLDEGLCYAQTHEKFMWAKDMLKTVGEDAQNKYYKVLVAFPLESMNGNVYHEADLREDVKTVTKGYPSLNHKDAYWFNPNCKFGDKTFEQSKFGSVYITGAEYEDGAVEALLKVPKSTVCPVTGELLHKVIDDKRIVNVSLEGFTASNGRFHFNEQIPFTLLMSNVLPGIPLARIFPIEQRLEAYLPGLQSQNHKRTIKIVGLEPKMKEEKPTADLCPKCGKPYTDCTCPKDEPEDKTEASAEPYAVSTVNPIKPVITNAGVTAKGPAIPDGNDQKTVSGESNTELKIRVLKAEQKASAAAVASAETEQKLTEAYNENNGLKGELKSLKQSSHERIESLEKQVSNLNIVKAQDIAEKRDLNRRLEDMTVSRDGYKTDLETLKVDHEKVTAKYREVLGSNLALEKRLTETNEEYLGIAKKAESLEDKIKHVNRITKVTAKF